MAYHDDASRKGEQEFLSLLQHVAPEEREEIMQLMMDVLVEHEQGEGVGRVCYVLQISNEAAWRLWA